MKIKSLFFSILAMSMMLVGCQKENPEEGKASMKLDPATLTFEKTASSQSVQVTCNRDWKVVDTDFPEWVTLTVDGKDIKGQTQKASGAPVTVTVTVFANEGTVRDASIVFNGGSLAKKTLTVNQDGIPVYHGDGTLEKPYSALDAKEAASKLADGQEVEAYVKGIISTIKKVDTSFGNAEYSISDDGTTTNEFIIYRGYYFNGEKFTSADQIKVGDEVVVFGKLINYSGDTPEMTTGSKIISLNGQTPEPPTPITGENLLTNSGFEEWDGNTPVAWKEVSSNAAIAKESTEKHGGSYSVKISNTSSSNSPANQRLMSKVYNLKAGKYQIDLFAKGEGSLRFGWAKVGDDGKVASGDDYFYLNDATALGAEWTQFTGQFELAATTKVSIVVMAAKPTAGKSFYADDVTLITENGGIDDSGVSAISLDKTSLSVAAEAGTQKVNVTSSVAWTATSGADWVTVSPESGSANAEVTLTIAANEGAARNATITFAGTAEKDKAVVVVSQAASSAVPGGDGTLDNPYSATEAIALANTLGSDGKVVGVYVKGIISSITSVDTGQFGNAEYGISDDGTTAVQFLVYRGYYLEGAKFTATDQIMVGDKVVILGDLVNYQGTTPEFTSGSKIISLDRDGDYLSVSPETISVKASDTSAQFTVSSNIESWTCSVDNGASVDKDSGSKSQTVTVTFEANTDTENAKTYTVTVKGGDITRTVTINQKAAGAQPSDDFTSSIVWTPGEKASSDKATVNGTPDISVLKLGTSKAAGNATLAVKAGTAKLSFYAVCWKDKSTKLKIQGVEGEISPKSNAGATGNPPYTLTVTDSDFYTVSFTTPLAADTEVEISTTTNERIILFAINPVE